MRVTLLLLTLLVCLSGCAERPANRVEAPLRAAPTPIPTPVTPRDGLYNGRGKVTKINMENGSVEVDHEAIEEVMPQAMKMEFNVQNKADLKPLKVGDMVEFVLEYKAHNETIVSIKKTK
jgi:Cu/Ag efflux protein CusF